MNLKPELSIVLPIYNPILNWVNLLDDSIKVINILFIKTSFKIIMVDDGLTSDLEAGKNYLRNRYDNVEIVSYPEN
ncbi:MAG: hypothetical protein ACOH2D_00735 [Gelidibacter sp.]|uniref:hypothetical protein n=1 Tax=Gelidibacter sp. TaxID=2018083 RepID=UPI00326725E3